MKCHWKTLETFFQITSYVVSELRTYAEQICVIEISEQHGENLHYHKWQLKCCPPVLPTRPDVPKSFQCLEMGKQMLILAMQFPPIVTSPESMAARSALDRLDFCDKSGNFVQIMNYYLVQIAAIFGSVHDTWMWKIENRFRKDLVDLFNSWYIFSLWRSFD